MSEEREEPLIAAETFGKASDERPQGAHVPRKVAFLELLDAPLERRAATATTVLATLPSLSCLRYRPRP